ncbi:21142_t:CDS:2 [Entrophospora sp. SA101]|nr:1847_t:CDS:2 [Entrophospora sp. SA101]CAJ0755359.1 16307_t:CDS:2 [Entrophospora sp. SA101]CAJ0766851.1 21142_t:CDS:2 [Entrophospora sp. SA101]CAJ0851171.1 5768_t:CDS:2 [Entrophospora sp. SA101]CAJ0878919.1 3736_t:CDS:2 [Entrophospora sp. SA101]
MSKLSLQNAILTYEQLETTPSRKDGIPEDLEDELRRFVAMATAQVLFQRFYYVASLKKFSIRDISIGALFLASKVQESPCKIRDLINVYHYLIRHYKHLPQDPLEPLGSVNALVIAEMQILKRLGFNVHVQLPYGLMVNYLKTLELTEHEVIPQKAWGYLNDALRTNIYVCYQPPTIACSVIWLAAKVSKVKLPTSLKWWELFEAEFSDIEKIASHITKLYALRLPSNLPLTLDELDDYLKNVQNKKNQEK